MSETVLLWLAGAAITVICALIGGMWANLASRIAANESRLEKHTGEETEGMWEKVDEIKDLVRQSQILNTEGHAQIGERIARIESRLPNGELAEIKAMVSALMKPTRAKR